MKERGLSYEEITAASWAKIQVFLENVIKEKFWKRTESRPLMLT